MRLVLIGPPGAGKGTQCKRLVERYGLKHLSSGDIFRSEMAKSSELGKTAKKYIDAGELVPDEIVIKMMTEAVEKAGGCILDGFPRTVNQAAELDKALNSKGCEVDPVIELEVDDDLVVSRLTKRRVCLSCGDTYHLVNLKPKVDNICDSCGLQLVQRDDDKKDVILNRLDTYKKLTKPIIDYYRQSGKKLIQVDASGSVDKVFNVLIERIDNI